jgi:uncharacterized damage-inducible protein DinB
VTRTLSRQWTEANEKLVELAEAFPEAQYRFRAADGTRSVAEQLRHVAFWNDHTAKTLRGEPADGAANELPAAKFATKAAIVRALRESVSGASRLPSGAAGKLSDAQSDAIVAGMQHIAEHYGQLVVLARLCGIVPPASRDA